VLGVPALGDLGLSTAQHGEVAGKAARSSSMRGNPVMLSHDELLAVLRQASEP
jgi:alcohol dehydrogenase class IV